MNKKRKKALSKKDKAMMKKLVYQNLKNYEVPVDILVNELIKAFKKINLV